MLLVARLFGFVARESHFFSWSCLPRSCEYCIVPCVWILCGFWVWGFWVWAGVSCGARRPGRSGQVLWVVAEKCRMQFPYQPFRY